MNKGFTLSEVLITLGIIGIVAAITIPTIISNTQDKQNIVHWRKMYSAINQAFIQTIQEGYVPCPINSYNRSCDEILAWPRHTEMDITFIEKMADKFNISEVCTSAECHHNGTVWAPDYYRRYNTLAGGKVASYNLSTYRVRLATGELIMFGGTHGGPWISVDVDGFGKGKDTVGKDLFIIKVYDKFLRPMGAQNTYGTNEFPNGCGCSKDIGEKTSSYISDTAGQGVVSGACCSAYYLLNDK